MRNAQDLRESLRPMMEFLLAHAEKAAPSVNRHRRPRVAATTAAADTHVAAQPRSALDARVAARTLRDPRETIAPRQIASTSLEGAVATSADIADIADIAEYRALGELYASDNATLREQVDELKARLDAEESRVAMLADERRRLLFHLRQKQHRAPDAAAPHPRSLSDPESVKDAVDAAATLFGDRLHFLPRAWTSAELSPFERPLEVLDAFRALADVAALRASSGSLRAPMRETLSAFGLDYRPGITRGTPRRLRQQYEIPDEEGNIHFCAEHLVFGTSLNPEHCLRIYLVSPTDDEPRFVIGHVGRHAETTT